MKYVYVLQYIINDMRQEKNRKKSFFLVVMHPFSAVKNLTKMF